MGLGTFSMRINGADCGLESILLGVATSIGGFLFGYDTGQISGFLVFDEFTRRFGTGTDPATGETTWVPITQSLMVSLMSIGSLIGALLSSYTSDWFGRRKNLTFFVGLFIIGNIVQITATWQNWVHMMMGRFVAGLGVGGLSVGVPMYQGECAPREIRGAVVASYQLFITIGILVSNLINYGVRNIESSDASWRIVIGLGIFFSLFLGFGVLLLPESPRWLASKHDWDGVRLSMARLRGKKDDPHHPLVEDDLQEMYAILEKESRAGVGSWAQCFSDRSSGISRTLYRTLLGFGLQFAQQWTGINYFMYYGAQIFGGVGIGDPLVVQLIIGAVNVVCTFPGLYFAERFGRRMPLFYGAVWQTGWLLIFAIMGTVLDPLENRGAGIAMIVAACMFIASFASTWGPFVWIVIAESFTLRTRAKQASLATAGNWLANWMIAFLTPLAADGIGYAFGFVLVGTNLAAALIVWFFLFESVGMSLENVDKMYSDESLKAWHSRKWVPPGYINRRERIPGYVEKDEGGVARTGSGRFSDETARPDMEAAGGKVPTEVRTEAQAKQTV